MDVTVFASIVLACFLVPPWIPWFPLRSFLGTRVINPGVAFVARLLPDRNALDRMADPLCLLLVGPFTLAVVLCDRFPALRIDNVSPALDGALP